MLTNLSCESRYMKGCIGHSLKLHNCTHLTVAEDKMMNVGYPLFVPQRPFMIGLISQSSSRRLGAK